MTTPLRVDTETFSDQFDFDEFARRLLAGTSGVGSLPTDQGPLEWLDRALPLLRSTPYEERLTRAIAGALTDPDPSVRREALRFFESHPQAAGAERVVELARGDRKLFAGVPDPTSKSIDLAWSLLRVVGAMANRGDGEAVEVARAESLNPDGNPEPLIAALTANDPDWVTANAESIVEKHPSAGSTILFNLEMKGRDVSAIGVKIAPIAAAGDKSFRADVKKYLDDANAKARILAAARKR